MGETIRAFVAIDFPAEVKRQVEKLIGELKELGVKAAWTRAENMHLTLKFLGETEVDQLDDVKRALDLAAGKQAPFQASLQGFGAFPNEKKPRVLWLGVSDGEKETVMLAGAVETALAPFGFEKEERDFTPHLTIARIKFPKTHPELEEKFLTDATRLFGGWKVTEIVLVQSTLHPEGPVYKIIHQAKLTS